MISLHWLMVVPPNLTAEEFDDWYLFSHTKYGKASLGIVRYTVNRAVASQPDAAAGTVYRIAQEYWEDWDAMELCWNTATGFAVRGEGLAHHDGKSLAGVAITEDVQLPVADPARYSTFARGYRGRDDGTHIKFMAYGRTGNPAGLSAWYRDAFAHVGDDPRVREHLFGTTLGRTLKVGFLWSLPAEGQPSYDWVLELWFDRPHDAREFMAGDAFRDMWAQLGQRSDDIVAALFRGQEMLVIAEPTRHRDD